MEVLLAAIKFSIYCPNTWFSDFSFKFSSFTESTLDDKSAVKQVIFYFFIPFLFEKNKQIDIGLVLFIPWILRINLFKPTNPKDELV
jgi:hypothetical protein